MRSIDPSCGNGFQPVEKKIEIRSIGTNKKNGSKQESKHRYL